MHHNETPEDIARQLENHVVIETQDVRTFRVHSHYVDKKYIPTLMKEKARYGYNSNWAFSITWRPGSLFLAGDLGEMTISHYHAMPNFDATIGWLCGADFEYLMGKSNKRPRYDAEESAKFILRSLNEPVLDVMLGPFGWGADRGKRSMKGALAEIRAARKEVQETGDPGYMDDIGPHPWKISSRMPSLRERQDRLITWFDFPEHWELWIRAYLFLAGYKSQHLWPAAKVEQVLNAGERAWMRGEIKRICEIQGDLVDFCQWIGFEDYYGTENYTWHDRVQYECIRFWAQEMRRRSSDASQLEAAE